MNFDNKIYNILYIITFLSIISIGIWKNLMDYIVFSLIVLVPIGISFGLTHQFKEMNKGLKISIQIVKVFAFLIALGLLTGMFLEIFLQEGGMRYSGPIGGISLIGTFFLVVSEIIIYIILRVKYGRGNKSID